MSSLFQPEIVIVAHGHTIVIVRNLGKSASTRPASFSVVGQICAKFRPNCSFSVKSIKFGTETVSKMTKKIGYGGKPEIAVLPS